MSGNVNFSVVVYIKNGEALPELSARLKDMSPAFQSIIPEWAELNKQKFGASQGMEETGVNQAVDVFWQPLKPGYIDQKRHAGFKDWLMVRTGSLMESLTNPDLIFQAVSAQDAIFGSPLDPDDAAKVGYNWARRQTIFLGAADQNMIRRIVKDYLDFGEGFESVRAGAVTQTAREFETERMDAEFQSDIGPDTGDWGHD